MSVLFHRAGVLLVVLLAFVLQQTGAARMDSDPCEAAAAAEEHGDEVRGCAEQGEEHCPPSCADCSGCPGPARGLMAQRPLVHAVPLVGALPPSWVASPIGVDPHLRVDRPPRS